MRQLFCLFAVLCSVLLTGPAFAQEGEETTKTPPPSYTDLRALYQGQLDRCDLINADKILSLTTTPMANLKEDKTQWLALIEETKKARQTCFARVENILEETITAGIVALQADEDNTALAARLELDKQAADMLEIRKKVTAGLLENMKQDFLDTLKVYNNTRRKKDRPSFIQESEQTTQLIRQDMGIVLEMERRRLSLEERLLARGPGTEKEHIKLKLRKALHYLTRALMAYEDLNRDSPAHLLADLRSEYLYAAGHMHEVLAIAPNLAPLPEFARQPLLQLANRMQLLELDVEGALRDFRSGTMDKNIENWLSELYQDLSRLSIEVNNLLQRIEMGAPIDAGAGDDLELPDDIAAFIKDDNAQTEAQGEPAPEEEKPE